MEYTKQVAFINRTEELKYLSQVIKKKPESILFIYGPKSSGKTTLLYKFINDIEREKKYHIKFLNLRKIWIGNYQHFIRAFFNVIDKNEKKTKKSIEFGAGIFKIGKETEQKLLKVEADPFEVMEKELIKINKQGRTPIIIIDELQELQEIYLNGQRPLINELFNFFVSMTKENHLAHIFICSSDGYFIERLYEDSRLRKTSEFYKIDYLPIEDVEEWLNDLQKYSKIKNLVLTKKQIKEIWDFLGGSCWEIQSLLSAIMYYGFSSAISKYRIQQESEVVNCINKDLERKKILNQFLENKFLSKEEIFNMANIEFKKLGEMLSQLVTENILFFEPVKATYRTQSRSIEYGIKQYFKK